MLFSRNQVTKTLLSLLACSFIGSSLIAQSDAEFIGSQLTEYSKKNLQEKIYVHTDKDFYVTGEIIWLRVYCVDAFLHQPLNFSKIAYAELIDSAGVAILQAKISLDEVKGAGSLFLPVGIASGNYRLRAYTNWMKNFSSQYFFEKTISVVNVRTNNSNINTVAEPMRPNVAFFPEGGQLLAGHSNSVGLKVSDVSGKGIHVAGLLVSNSGDTLTRFNTLRYGMGKFTYTPEAGKTYETIVTLADGRQFRQDLPVAAASGSNMTVTEQGNKIDVQVRTTGAGNVFLVAHTRGITKLALAKPVTGGQANFSFDASSLGDGISSITIFNNDRQPVCERLHFKYPAGRLVFDVKTDKTEYNPREKVSIGMTAKTEMGKPAVADMSMSVFMLHGLQDVSPATIESYLWLSSDIAGDIESPGYYFDEKSADRREAIDNLLLTQGWRRFKWNDVLAAKPRTFKYAPELSGHIVQGTVIDTRTGLPAIGITGYVSAAGPYATFRESVSDEEGNIRFDLKNFYGGAELIAQTNADRDSMYRVDIASPFSKEKTGTALQPLTIGKQYFPDLLNGSISAQVQNIYLSDEQRTFSANNIDTGTFYLKTDEAYQLDNYTRFTTMEEVLREYVRAINVRKRSSGFALYSYDAINDVIFDNFPVVLVDGVPVFNLNRFMAIDPLKVQSMEVVSRRYYLGLNAYEGILNVVTYKGDLGGYELDANALVIDYEGLQLKREFYSPTYESPAQKASHLPDFRQVLHWTPSILSGADGNAPTQFYTSDLKGKYAVVTEGISADGRTGAKITVFDIK